MAENDDLASDPWTDPMRPPPEAGDAIDCGDGVWVSWASPFNDGEHPSAWHWCTRENWRDRPLYNGPRWMVAGTRAHTLVSRDPIHLEPSVYWPDCCGKHGFIRGGRWTTA